MYRDQERRNKMHGEAEKSRMQQSEAGALDKSLTKCPTCHTVISKGLKICPRCKARIVSSSERLMQKIFTPTNMMIFGSIVVIVTMIFIGFMFPELVREILGLFRK